MTSPPAPVALDLSSELHRRADRLGPKPFLRLPDGDLSWAETDERVGCVAAGLVDRGFGTGAVIMTAGGAVSTQLLVWFAAQRVGAVWAPLNPLLTGRSLAAVAAHADADVIVIDPGSTAEAALLGPPAVDIDDLTAADPYLPPTWPYPSDARAKLMFTSGTTGDPKGVIWSRRCEAVWAEAYGRELLDVAEGEGLFTCLPMSHVTGQGTVLAAMQRGAVLTVADGFSPFRFWEQVRASEARRFTYVGTILSTLLKRRPGPEERDHQLDRIVGAGTPVKRWPEIEERFGVTVVETWGQTESAGCFTRPARLPQRPGTIGQPCDRFDIHLDDPETGSELLLRPTDRGAIFDGYLRPDGTIESPYDSAGWYHTGDVLRRDPDGALTFLGRRRESIRRRGEIVASTPIEEIALEHPGVFEAAAVGVASDDGADEEIKLCFTETGPEPTDLADLHRFLRDRLPGFMVPRYLQAVPTMPKTPSTRIQKFKLASAHDGVWDARRRRSHPSR